MDVYDTNSDRQTRIIMSKRRHYARYVYHYLFQLYVMLIALDVGVQKKSKKMQELQLKGNTIDKTRAWHTHMFVIQEAFRRIANREIREVG